jgi:hypothetical protein
MSAAREPPVEYAQRVYREVDRERLQVAIAEALRAEAREDWLALEAHLQAARRHAHRVALSAEKYQERAALRARAAVAREEISSRRGIA